MKNNRKGMTLIELIVAMAIIGIIAVVFLRSFSSGYIGILNGGKRAKAMSSAQSLIDREIEARNVGSTVLDPGKSKVDYAALTAAYTPGEDYRYWLTTKSVTVPLSGYSANVNVITVLVFYQNGQNYVTLVSQIP